jgi:dihydropyrimidinase
MSYDLVIRNGRLIAAHADFVADLAVNGETIAAIGIGLHGKREIDAAGLYVLPGAIDGHVHLTDPTYWPYSPPTADSFATASVAGAIGGVTSVVDFAQPAPGQSLVEALERRQEDADGQSVIDYGLHLTLRDPDPARLQELPAVFDLGAASVKLFMAYEGYRLDDTAIFRAMEAVAALNGLAVVHAENYDIIQELRRRQAAAGQHGPRWHTAACPPETEGEAVHRALALAKLAGARLLVYHQSCAEGVRELQLAKARGQDVYGEVCIQYLVLTDDVYQSDDDLARSLCVSPPLRGREHQAALWEGVAAGSLDIVSTDHNPRHPQGQPPVQPPGTSGIETRLALLHTFGVATGRLSLQRWVDVCCTRPALVFGMARKGQLAPGYDADIVMFDPNKTLTLSPETLHSPIGFCSYQGITVKGFPVATISRGQVIVQDGRYVGHPGHGRYIARGY